MRLGLALGGGGAKGMAHIGVLRVLDAARVPVHVVVGTSAGAIAGALYAAGKSPDEIDAAVRRLRLPQLLPRDRTEMGLFSTAGIHQVIDAAIGDGKRIEDLPRAFAAIAVEMESGEEIVIESGRVADAVSASAAFPGLFAPTQIDGRWFFDGGVSDPVPFGAARRRGADRVIAVDLGADEPVLTGAPARHQHELFYRLLLAATNQKSLRVAGRAIGIMSKQIRLQRLRESPPDLILQPDVSDVGLIDLDLVDECIAAGEQAARAALPQIEKLIALPEWRYRAQRTIERARGRTPFLTVR